MNARTIVDRYYEYANAGDWDRWCDLFAVDVTIDEQLAGHVEGREKLRSMMSGFPAMYASFQNKAVHVLVDGGQAGVVSHISAVTPAGQSIEAEVMNYFRIEDGLISYMANFHDTAPFGVLEEG